VQREDPERTLKSSALFDNSGNVRDGDRLMVTAPAARVWCYDNSPGKVRGSGTPPRPNERPDLPGSRQGRRPEGGTTLRASLI